MYNISDPEGHEGKSQREGINITKVKLYDKSQYSAPQSQRVNEFYMIRKDVMEKSWQ